jgi:RNA polymerase sigma-70 factor (ECF subfamily)
VLRQEESRYLGCGEGEVAEGGSVVRDDVMPGWLLEQARGGNAPALGELLELYRNYLRLVARSLISNALRVKLEPSDIVQETFLKAHREFTRGCPTCS